jgi:hypothetical protein
MKRAGAPLDARAAAFGVHEAARLVRDHRRRLIDASGRGH